MLGSLVAPLHMRPACSLASATHFLPALTGGGREEEFQAFTAFPTAGVSVAGSKKSLLVGGVGGGRREAESGG